MKNDPITALLLAIMFGCGAAACVLTYQYVHSVSTIQVLQRQRIGINRELGAFQSMLNDALEYGKRNPAFEPTLQAIGVKLGHASTNNISIKP